MADKNLGTPSDRHDTDSDDENVTLTAGELDNLFGGAEVSEVSLESPDKADDLPELPDLEETGLSAGDEDELPSLDDPSQGDGNEIESLEGSGDLPELPSLDLEAREEGEPIGLDESIPEDLPTPEDLPSSDDMKDVELPELKEGDGNATDEVAVLEDVQPEDDLPALDTMELPDLEVPTANRDQEDEVEILPPTTAQGDGDGEDETVSLSEGELGNILSDVDESQVLELEGPNGATEDDEIVSVSGEELDSITQDAEGGEEALAEAPDVTSDSLNFEAEIMEDAQVHMAKPDEIAEGAEDDLPAEEGPTEPEELNLDDSMPELPTLDLADREVDAPTAEPEEGPEEVFDEIQTIPAPPDPASDSELGQTEDLEVIDLSEVHEAARPPEAPALDPVTGAGWDGSITEADLAGAPQTLGKMQLPHAGKSRPAAHKVDDKELYDLLKYLDTLLEHLPEEHIRAFAESRHYDRYISLINRLGL